MKSALPRCLGKLPPPFDDFTIPCWLAFCVAVFPLFAQAQTPFPDASLTRSVSGQFIITAAPSSGRGTRLAARPEIATNTDLIRLEPAFLSVSAERIKESLRKELNRDLRNLEPNAPAHGKIFLVLHAAQTTDEDVIITSRRSLDGWDYQVQLPDVVTRTRFMRAMTGVLLLEIANRDARARSAEIPAWLTDGLSQELLASGWEENILSLPDKIVNGLPVSRTVTSARGMDSLAGARRVLREQTTLTFEQLSWPTDVQLSGEDEGAYRASAQLFVNELLDLKNGPAHLRAMIETLPDFYNWQTAFQAAFGGDFPRPLDVEKWWSVQVVSFVARDLGPAWTPAVSRVRLDEILSVPVEMRVASNALPVHVEISFQAVIRNFSQARQAAVLQPKLRNLELSQLRLAPQYAVLADGYRRALADYLGLGHRPSFARRWIKHPFTSTSVITLEDALTQLDALDVQRRTVESTIKPESASP